MSASLDAKTVLVIEDQFLIAIDTEQALRRSGAVDVRLASSVGDALQALGDFVPDVVVLDFVLGDSTAVDVAKALTDLAIPFVFATGYGDNVAIPVPYKHVPLVQKPFSVDNLVLQLNLVTSTAAGKR